MKIEKDLEELKKEIKKTRITEEKFENIRKFGRIIIFITIFVLIILYFILSPSVLNVFAGLFQSEKISENSGHWTIQYKENTIILTNQVYQKILELQEKYPHLEFKACLKGKVEENTYHITEIYEPLMWEQHYTYVKAESCPKETLISLHSHPKLQCLFSEQDKISFQNLKQNNPKALMAVFCDKERFNFYD